MAVEQDTPKVPQLRFPEFVGEWEEKRSGEEIDYRNGLNFTLGSSGQSVKIVGVANFQDNVLLSDSSNLSEIIIEGSLRKSDLLEEGDLLFVRSNGNKALIGRCLQIGTLAEPISCSGFTIRGRRTGNAVLPNFSALLFRSSRFRSYLNTAGGGTNISNLSQAILQDYELSFPTLPEQKKIAAFLGAVDEKIAQLKEKKDLLTAYKKGCMQQIFSQQIRFKRDDGSYFPDWEEKRLGDVAEINPKSQPLPPVFQYIDLESVVQGRLLESRQLRSADAPSRAQRLLKVGDVLFQMVRPYQRNNLYFENKGEYVASTGYAQLRTRTSGGFLFQLLHTNQFVSAVLDRCTGTSYPAINSTDLAEIYVGVPSHPDEQRKIADFLSAIDAKIDLVAQELDHAKTFKKGLLQQMFV